MGKYKICVYAICKNESKFVKRWLESIKDADYICVLDTGSTDNTMDLFKESNVYLKQKIIEPFRFDEARNESLKLIPEDTDICISLDLDEIMQDGWRNALENLWKPETNRMRYIYNWSLDSNNKPIVSFYGEKIHSYKDYIWVNPVHEVLKFQKENENIVTTDELVINHYPDSTKSRSSYLPLLELSVKEDPENDRNVHYLGREYMYYGRWNESIDMLIKHLNLKSATWKDERCASMRFIARCYTNLKRYDEAKMWLEKAIKEAPHLRDPYIELALLYNDLNDYEKVIYYTLEALKIPLNYKTYINEVFSFDETANDLLSIAYYNENDLDKAIYYANEALKINPENQRIKNNLELMEKEKSAKN